MLTIPDDLRITFKCLLFGTKKHHEVVFLMELWFTTVIKHYFSFFLFLLLSNNMWSLLWFYLLLGVWSLHTYRIRWDELHQCCGMKSLFNKKSNKVDSDGSSPVSFDPFCFLFKILLWFLSISLGYFHFICNFLCDARLKW